MLNICWIFADTKRQHWRLCGLFRYPRCINHSLAGDTLCGGLVRGIKDLVAVRVSSYR